MCVTIAPPSKDFLSSRNVKEAGYPRESLKEAWQIFPAATSFVLALPFDQHLNERDPLVMDHPSIQYCFRFLHPFLFLRQGRQLGVDLLLS